MGEDCLLASSPSFLPENEPVGRGGASRHLCPTYTTSSSSYKEEPHIFWGFRFESVVASSSYLRSSSFPPLGFLFFFPTSSHVRTSTTTVCYTRRKEGGGTNKNFSGIKAGPSTGASSVLPWIFTQQQQQLPSGSWFPQNPAPKKSVSILLPIWQLGLSSQKIFLDLFHFSWVFFF